MTACFLIVIMTMFFSLTFSSCSIHYNSSLFSLQNLGYVVLAMYRHIHAKMKSFGNWSKINLMFRSFCVILRLSIAFRNRHRFAHVAFGYFEIRIRFDSQTAFKSILNIWCTHFVLCAAIEWSCFRAFYLISFVSFIIPAQNVQCSTL